MSNFKNELKGYQCVPNELIFDNTMSDRARFLFCWMCSKPDGWNFYMKNMSKEVGYSEDTLRKYINELVESGWLVKGEQQNINGMFGNVKYTLLSAKKTDTVKSRHGKTMAHIQTETNRSEEHTSELQSPDHLVCRLLLE